MTTAPLVVKYKVMPRRGPVASFVDLVVSVAWVYQLTTSSSELSQTGRF
jgi:hypothetical protein